MSNIFEHAEKQQADKQEIVDAAMYYHALVKENREGKWREVRAASIRLEEACETYAAFYGSICKEQFEPQPNSHE